MWVASGKGNLISFMIPWAFVRFPLFSSQDRRNSNLLIFVNDVYNDASEDGAFMDGRKE